MTNPTKFPVQSFQGLPIQKVVAPLKGGTVYMNFCGGIDQGSVSALMSTFSQVVQQREPETLYFLFSSAGGQVAPGITLFNFLKSLPVKLVTHNMGSIDSIATVIFMAGEQRYAAPSTSFHFHGVSGMPSTGQPIITTAWLREQLSRLEEDENKIAKIISSRSKVTAEELQALFRQGQSKDLSFALEKVLIHEVREVKIPKVSQIITFGVQNQPRAVAVPG